MGVMENEIRSIDSEVKEIASRWRGVKSFWKDGNALKFESNMMEPLQRMSSRYLAEARETCRLLEKTLRELNINGL